MLVRFWWLAAAAVTAVSASVLTFAAPAAANPNAVNPIPVLNGTMGLPQLHGRTQAVFQATGMASPNNTQNYNVLGTDLGIMWDNGRGEMLTAYGDTAGLGFPNLLAGSVWAWRSNILLRSHDRTPGDGIVYDSVVRDIFGQAKDLVPSPKIPFIEISRIPDRRHRRRRRAVHVDDVGEDLGSARLVDDQLRQPRDLRRQRRELGRGAGDAAARRGWTTATSR